jgi:hypothetical protein
MDRVIVFYPTTELHFDTFYALIPNLERYSLDYIFLITDRFNDRSFNYDSLNEKNIFRRNDPSLNSILREFVNVLKGRFRNGCIIVGNDGHPAASKVIRYIKKNLGYLSIMIQDGWIEHINILRPVKNRNKIKWFLHFLKNHKYSPFNKMGTLNIGATADLFFVFSEYFRKEFICGGIPDDRVIVTGNPQFEIAQGIFTKKKQILSEEVVVFFGTDFLFPESRGINLRALKWVINLRDKYWVDKTIVIKPHPIGDHFHYNEIIKTNDNIFVYTENIYSLFEKFKIDVAFTISSTVILSLLVGKIKFYQLAPPPLSKSEDHYLKDFHIFEKYEDLDYYISKNMVYDLNKIDLTYYLQDCDPNFKSSIEIVKYLDKLI